MQKRVLAFLMVMAMVLSLLPVSLVAAETETAAPEFTMTLQKAHNQTDGSLAIDIYLQATVDTVITGYEFKVNPKDGITWTGTADTTGNENVKASEAVVYDPAGEKPITVTTSRVRVATITVVAADGVELPTQAVDAVTLSDVVISTDSARYDVTNIEYLNVSDVWSGVEGEWLPLDQATFDTLEQLMTDVNYFLVEDITTQAQVKCSNVNLDLNGYTFGAAGKNSLIAARADMTLTINDATATGSALEGTLKAGTLKAGNNNRGGLYAGYGAVLTVSNVNMDGSALEGTASGNLLYAVGKNDTKNGGKLIATNVHVFGGKASAEATDPVVMSDAQGDIELNEVRFSDFDLTPNPAAADTTQNALMSARNNANYGNMIINDVVADTCYSYCVYVMNTESNKFGSLTIKGDTQLADPIYVANEGTPVVLELGANADITLETATELTAEELGKYIQIAEGATLPAGTLLYKNNGMHVTYENGVFGFSGHSHKAETYANGTKEGHTVEGMGFKAWDDPNALPAEGNWYLTTDVNMTAQVEIATGTTLNLDLNGHTVTQTTEKARHFLVNGTLNLFDCQSGYDAEGNWIGGQLTGGTHSTGASVAIARSEANKTDERSTFNMYGGRIAGNCASATGGAVYIFYSEAATDGVKAGGIFNMFGGELYNNSSETWGGAITVMGYAYSSDKGADPELGIGAQFNMHGGKIHGNNTYKTTDTTTYADGTIMVRFDAQVNMTGGEICNNSAERGGAFHTHGATAKVNITGGKIYGNSAVESEYKRTQYTLKADDSTGKYTSHTIYVGKGGAFYCASGTVTVKNAELSGNTSTQGGMLYATGGSSTNVLIEDCTIDGNVAHDSRTEAFPTESGYKKHNNQWGNGGAAYILTANTAVTLKNCQVTNNISSKVADLDDYCGAGGGIYANGAKKVVVDGCTFTGNDAGMETGGAIHLCNDAAADVKNCVITGNQAGQAGGGIYTVNSSVLKLTDTVIYENSNDGKLNGAGVYVTSKGGRVILSGKVVIAENSNMYGKAVYRDLYFQKQSSGYRELTLVEVNELGEGSHINAYFDETDSPIYTNGLASGYVKITEGGTQSDWQCGWITFGVSLDDNRQVAYIDLTDDGADNKTFEWGHYHKAADGTYYKLNEWTSADTLPGSTDENGIGYYLTQDVTISTAINLKNTAHKEAGLDYELCLNGFDITAADDATSGRAISLRSVNGWVGDCTAAFDENGHLLKGGRIYDVKNSENGGALYITDDSSIGTNVTVYGIELEGCYETATRDALKNPGYSGGAIHARGKSRTVDNTNVTVIGCKFTGNHTPMEGGAISSFWGADFIIRDTVFEGNYAGRFGGAISMVPDDKGTGTVEGELTIDNCRFVDNYVTSNPTLWTDKTTTDVDESITPARNTGFGGAIYAAPRTTVTVTDSYFEGNQAANAEKLTNINYTDSNGVNIGQGGAIYMGDTADLSVDGSEFVNNFAEYTGGAICYYAGNNSITNSTFEGNTANQFGGALFALNTRAVLTVSDSAFVNNASMGQSYTKTDGSAATTNGSGGAIECMNGKTTLSNVEFTGNAARLAGGGVRLGGGGGTIKEHTVTDCYFGENEVTNGSGGGLYIHARTADTNITDTDFEDNTASKNGGGLYLTSKTVAADTDGDGTSEDISDPDVKITGGSFIGNSSKTYAGALYIEGITTVTAEGVTFENNESTAGGALCTNDATVNSSFNNCNFTGNAATNGGVSCHELYETVTYTGCTFEDNTASKNGGALYLRGDDNAVVTIGGVGDATCTFTGNQATTGGAVWCGSGTNDQGTDETADDVSYRPTTNIINSTFTENVATSDVAAIRSANGHQVTVTDSTIQNNTSKQYGALHVATSNAGLTLAGKMIVTDNVSTNYVDHAENTDLYYQNYTTKAGMNAKVDMSALTEGSSIGVYVAEERMVDEPVLTLNSSAAAKDYLFANCDRVILAAKDNEIVACKYIDENGETYSTVQAAIEAVEGASGTTFKLQASTEEELTLTTVNYIDLNGKDAAKVTVPTGMELTLVDTTTNDYDCSDGYGSVTVEGAYKAYVEDESSGSLKRYVVIADENGKLSAHRIYLAITTKTLRPANNGVGFKAIFAGDQVVAEQVTYGLELSGYKDFSQVLTASFDTMAPGRLNGTPNQKTVVLVDAITAENQSRWDEDVYGRPFITIGDQTICGKDVAINMKEMAEHALNGNDQTVIDAVNNMMRECGLLEN